MTDEPTLDYKTLLIAGQVVDQVAKEMKMDEVSQDYRDGYRDAGRIMAAYGMLLGMGFSMEQLRDLAVNKMKSNNAADVEMMKKLLGDDK